MLRSPIREERLLALVILVNAYERGTAAERARIATRYLASTRWINNWDLVDASAPAIIGEHVREGDRALLDRLAASRSLWERRIAMVATLSLIKSGDVDDALRVAERLLDDEHDLIHKASGWMLRAVDARAMTRASSAS
jgi:3-methyladenine DNA glycosylase AlkD